MKRPGSEARKEGEIISREKKRTELLSVNMPQEVKDDLKRKAKKYNTDMSTLTKLILTCVLKQI